MKKFEITTSCAGPLFSAVIGEIWEETPRNADWLEGIHRAGYASLVGEKKKTGELEEPHEDPDVLPDVPPPAKGNRRNRKATGG